MHFADDIRLYQWLIADDGNIRLNDFNRAEFMLYDEDAGEYCRYQNGVGPGSVSDSPPQYITGKGWCLTFVSL